MTLREMIESWGYDDVTLFENFDYSSAFIGMTSDNRAVYDYELMVEYLMEKEGWTEEESAEWIDYNTIRALPYFPNAPVILYRYDIHEFDEK